MSYAPDATAYDACRNASDPVAQKFSTRLTGFPTSSRGFARVIPQLRCAVPSQYASMSCFVRPTGSSVSFTACTIRSSALRSQCSPNGVHPTLMIATRSRMPCEPIYEAPFNNLAFQK